MGKNIKIIPCEREISVGAEHRVYLAEDGNVIKTPTAFGRFWHNMDSGLAGRDQTLLKCYKIPHVPTVIEEGPLVIQMRDGVSQLVDYAMKQPFVDSRPLNFLEMAECPDVLEDFTKMVKNSERMFGETKLGVDFIGGKAIIELLRAFFKWRVNATLHNILLPVADQYDEDGQIFARANGPVLCDTRLYDCSGQTGNLFSYFREGIQFLQYEIFDRFLRDLNKDYPIREIKFKTLLHKIAASLLYVFIRKRLGW